MEGEGVVTGVGEGLLRSRRVGSGIDIDSSGTVVSGVCCGCDVHNMCTTVSNCSFLICNTSVNADDTVVYSHTGLYRK